MQHMERKGDQIDVPLQNSEEKIVPHCSTSVEKPKSYKCTHENCTAEFSRENRLEQHVRVHTGERPFQCQEEGCGRSYTRAAHLKRHTENCHSTAKYEASYQCPHPTCTRVLKTSQFLQRHYQRAHKSSPKTYKCLECDQIFRKHHTLKAHQIAHTGEKSYTCQKEDCGKNFETLRLLRSHMKRHDCTYKCDHEQCGKVFNNWTLLRKHRKIEHPPSYECKTCKKRFLTKANLRAHEVIHQEKREMFHCPFEHCPRYYYQEKNLNHHIKSNHEGKLFTCTIENCGRQLSTKQKLQAHQRLHDAGYSKPKPKKKNTQRKCKPRRDKGTVKRSMAVKIAGVSVPYEEEKQQLQKWTEGNDSENGLQSQVSEESMVL